MAPDSPRDERYTVSVTWDERKALDFLLRSRGADEETFLREFTDLSDLEIAELSGSFLKLSAKGYELYSLMTSYLWVSRGVLYEPVSAGPAKGPSDLDRIVEVLGDTHTLDSDESTP